MQYIRILVMLCCTTSFDLVHATVSVAINQIAKIGEMLALRVMFEHNVYKPLNSSSNNIIEYITNNPYLISAQLSLTDLNIRLFIRNGSSNQPTFIDFIVPQFLLGRQITLYPLYDNKNRIVEYRCKTNISYTLIHGSTPQQDGESLTIFYDLPSANPLYKCQHYSFL